MSKYHWTPGHQMPVDEFVKRFKPSIIEQNDTPFIWVSSGLPGTDPDSQEGTHGNPLEDGSVVALVEKIEAIENDDSIPVRAKKGIKSKKAIREEAHEEAATKLKDISLKSGLTVGKWMFFPRTGDHVDHIWSLIARSVAYGPLKAAGVRGAKVSSCDPNAGEMGSHVICVYVDNLYDKEAAKTVLVSLLKEHGLEPASCKSDLYTYLNIDSKHPSKLRSTIWKVAELVDGGVDGVKKLKEAFKAGDDKKWKQGDNGEGGSAEKDGAEQQGEGERSTRTVSFSDNVEAAPKRKTLPTKRPVKRQKSAAALYKENDMFVGSDSDE